MFTKKPEQMQKEGEKKEVCSSSEEDGIRLSSGEIFRLNDFRPFSP